MQNSKIDGRKVRDDEQRNMDKKGWRREQRK